MCHRGVGAATAAFCGETPIKLFVVMTCGASATCCCNIADEETVV